MKITWNKLLNKLLSNQMTSPLNSWLFSPSKKWRGLRGLRVDVLSLSSSCETRTKPAISRASHPGISNGHFFSRFTVSLDGLSKGGTTRSLIDGSNQKEVDLRLTTSGPHFTTDRSWNLLSCFMGCNMTLLHLNVRKVPCHNPAMTTKLQC